MEMIAASSSKIMEAKKTATFAGGRASLFAVTHPGTRSGRKSGERE
jgi:hypothetical protein